MAAIPELKATRCRAGFLMPRPRVLLVDDDPDIRELLIAKLGEDGFDVTEACDVNGALRHIASNSFDVLVSDLHMPGAADGLTVISAMRHANPETVTILFSAFPQMDIAVKTILAQTDQILVKPSGISTLSKTIRARFAQDFFSCEADGERCHYSRALDREDSGCLGRTSRL